jgi:chitinase
LNHQLTLAQVVSKMSGSDGKGIESKANWLHYPDSMYDNVKNGFKA